MLRNLTFFSVAFLLNLISFQNRAQSTADKFTNLGPQVFASLIQGSVFADDNKGNSYVYTVVRGRPARFVGFTLNPLKKVVDAELPGTDGSWDAEVSSEGIVYIAGANGILYQHQPGTNTITSLGKALPSEKLIWDLAAGKNGEIFGGTYPGCRVFRYHPAVGFTDVGRGALQKDENYVRSLAYDRNTKKVYAGIASHSALVELNPKSGKKRQLLADKNRDQEAVYHINLVNGIKGGDRVYGWLTGSAKRITIVYNLTTGKFEDDLPSMDVKSIIKSRHGSEVYYSADKKLYVIDYAAKTISPKQLVDLEGETKTIKWGRDGILYLLSGNQYLQTYDPATGKLTSVKLEVPSQAIDIQSIGHGPDGLIWTGGYLAGGHASYDPVTGKNVQHPGLDQTEGMANMGSSIYFGIYPKARLYAYDTKTPWKVKEKSPRFLGQVKAQDRPFAVLGLENLNKVMFGTVPNYGKLGGAIVEYDVAADKLETFYNIIPDHSIASLVAHGNQVIGGTTIFGGLGIVPSEKEGKIFGWDPQLNKKTFELVPVAGAVCITGLINGPDGNIWGVADGDLFIFDPVRRAVVSKHQLFEMNVKPTHVWRSAFIVIHPSGDVYISVNGGLLKVDPKTKEFTKIKNDVSLLTMDNKGSLYFKRGADLWRYEP